MSAPTLSRTPPSPPALRARRPGWRDPRLAAGVVIVALSGLVGARLLANADDTVSVWTARHDLVAGQVLGVDDLATTRIRFTDPADADRYLSADEAFPERTVLRRDIGAGELLPRAVLGTRGEDELVELPVGVATSALPASLEVGDLVDVWVTAQGSERAVAVLSGVPVLGLPAEPSSISTSAERQVVLGLDEESAELLPRALALMAEGTTVLTSRGAR